MKCNIETCWNEAVFRGKYCSPRCKSINAKNVLRERAAGIGVNPSQLKQVTTKLSIAFNIDIIAMRERLGIAPDSDGTHRMISVPLPPNPPGYVARERKDRRVGA